MASEKNINLKKEEVSKLAEKIKEAKIVLLTDYRGINVADVTELRAELRKSNSEYKVIKNNITRRALAEAGIEGLEDLLEGPTAVIMNNEDYLETAKTIYNYSKDKDFVYYLLYLGRTCFSPTVFGYNYLFLINMKSRSHCC